MDFISVDLFRKLEPYLINALILNVWKTREKRGTFHNLNKNQLVPGYIKKI